MRQIALHLLIGPIFLVNEALPKLRQIDPAAVPPADLYALLTGCVIPRPIAFVSSLSASGTANLAPFSFFNAGGANPPSLVLSTVTSGAGRDKDTLHNVRATGEYVVHIAPWSLREKMNQTSADYAPEVDEFEMAGFTKAPSAKVKPWRAAECPIAMECRLFQIVRHGEGPFGAHYVIGEVVLGDDVGVWFCTVIRGDTSLITVGDRTNVQDGSMLHSDHGVPLTIGAECTIGHHAILHGSTIGDRVLVGMGATILNQAVIGDECVIGANALVTEGKEIPDGSMVLGSPGKIIRQLSEDEIRRNAKAAVHYVANWQRFSRELRPLA